MQQRLLDVFVVLLTIINLSFSTDNLRLCIGSEYIYNQPLYSTDRLRIHRSRRYTTYHCECTEQRLECARIVKVSTSYLDHLTEYTPHLYECRLYDV